MTARERRVVVGGALAVLLILAGAFVPRLLGGRDDGGPAAMEAERVARLRGLAASLDTLRKVAGEGARRERELRPLYLTGGTPQVAAAALSAALGEIADRSRVEILREGVLPATPAGAATAVPLLVTARGDLPGLLDLLQEIERGPLLLTVEQLTVSADPRERPGVPSLTLTLRVAGFLPRRADQVHQ